MRMMRYPIIHQRDATDGEVLLAAPDSRPREVVASRSSFSRLCSLLLPHQRLFLDVLLAAVLMTVLGLTSSFFIQAPVDFVFVLGRTPALNWLGLEMPLVSVSRAGFLGLSACLLTHLSQRIDAEAVMGYHRHLLGLPLSFFCSRRQRPALALPLARFEDCRPP